MLISCSIQLKNVIKYNRINTMKQSRQQTKTSPPSKRGIPKKNLDKQDDKPNDWGEVTDLVHCVQEMLEANNVIVQVAARVLMGVKDLETFTNTEKQEMGGLILSIKKDIQGFVRNVNSYITKYNYRKGPVLEDELLDFYDICLDVENLMKDVTTVLNEPIVDLTILTDSFEKRMKL